MSGKQSIRFERKSRGSSSINNLYSSANFPKDHREQEEEENEDEEEYLNDYSDDLSQDLPIEFYNSSNFICSSSRTPSPSYHCTDLLSELNFTSMDSTAVIVEEPIKDELTIEGLRDLYNSCFTCGVSWNDDHISLDCKECGGYAMDRPCPECDGSCGTVWKRNIGSTHGERKARWEGKCKLQSNSTLGAGGSMYISSSSSSSSSVKKQQQQQESSSSSISVTKQFIKATLKVS